MGIEMNDIKIIKSKSKERKFVIEVDLDSIYIQGGCIMKEFEPLKITVDRDGVHIGNLNIEGKDGLSQPEVCTIIKALGLAIDLNNFELEIG